MVDWTQHALISHYAMGGPDLAAAKLKMMSADEQDAAKKWLQSYKPGTWQNKVLTIAQP